MVSRPSSLGTSPVKKLSKKLIVLSMSREPRKAGIVPFSPFDCAAKALRLPRLANESGMGPSISLLFKVKNPVVDYNK